MARYNSEVHWRDAARSPKFFGIDGKAAIPLMFFLLHMRLWTFVLTLSCAIFFAILSHFGFSFRVFLIRVRGVLGGRHKVARPWWRR